MTTPARRALDWVLSLTEPPPESVLVERFSSGFLSAVPSAQLSALLPTLAASVRDELDAMHVTDKDAHNLLARIGGTEVLVVVEAADPHQISGLLFRPAVVVVSDPRLVNPPVVGTGPLAELAVQVFTDDGHIGLSVHTDDRGTTNRTIVGWADLASGRVLTADDVFPAYSITKLLTTVVVLQLDLDLDAPVASLLHELRVPPDVTLRHLLTHHGGLSNAFSHWEEEVPSLLSLLGPEVAVDRPAGQSYAYSNAGFGVLGQVIADVTGRSFEQEVSKRVLEPLGMTSSSFPRRVPAEGVVLHDIADGGAVAPSEAKICTVPSAGGLWSTAADLATFGRDWATLLPPAVAAAAVSPQAQRSETAAVGFGFMVSGDKRVVGHGGGGIGASSSLLAIPSEGLVAVTVTNRSMSIEPTSFKALELALAVR